MLVALSLTNSLTLAGVIIAALILVLAGLFTLRSNVAQVWKDNYEGEKERANRLELALQDAMRTIGEQKEIIERLSSLPNLEKVIKLMSDSAERTDQRATDRLAESMTRIEELFTNHEDRAMERHDSATAVLSGIAANLGRLVRKGA